MLVYRNLHKTMIINNYFQYSIFVVCENKNLDNLNACLMV